ERELLVRAAGEGEGVDRGLARAAGPAAMEVDRAAGRAAREDRRGGAVAAALGADALAGDDRARLHGGEAHAPRGAAAGSAAERVAAGEAGEEAVAGQAAGVIERGRGVAGGEPPRLVAREARPVGGARGPAGRGGDAEADLGVIRAQTIR